MSETHHTTRRTVAIPCFAIYADYDGEAPDTANLAFVADHELAEEVLAVLNGDPRAYGIAFVDGYEGRKSFRARPALVEVSDEGMIHTSSEALLADEDWQKNSDEDEDSDEEVVDD